MFFEIQHQTQQLLHGLCGREHEPRAGAQQQRAGDRLRGGRRQRAAHLHGQRQGAGHVLPGTGPRAPLLRRAAWLPIRGKHTLEGQKKLEKNENRNE